MTSDVPASIGYDDMRRLLSLPDLSEPEPPEPIGYAEMRRLLGLPDPAGPESHRPPQWTVRRITTGTDTGRWGVWRVTGGEAEGEPVGSYPTWRDAITAVEHDS